MILMNLQKNLFFNAWIRKKDEKWLFENPIDEKNWEQKKETSLLV